MTPCAGRPLLNPYQEVMRIMTVVLEMYSSRDHGIQAFGFGDAKTRGHSVFSFAPEGSAEPLRSFSEIMQRYREIVPTLTLSGPTSFAPAIHKALELVKETNEYHILIIIADGQINDNDETAKAIVEASNYPLSIITVGVGDGPWRLMEVFDDSIKGRRFDNFQFVKFHDCMAQSHSKPEVNFALNALMEIPDQLAAIRQLGLLPPKHPAHDSTV